MADPRTATCPNLIKLCEDAARLGVTYPPPVVEKAGSWRPAPYDCGPASAWLSGGMQPPSV
jgi:hypothetical protein